MCVCVCAHMCVLPKVARDKIGLKKNWERRTYIFHTLAERPWSVPALGHGIATYGDTGCVTQNSRACFSWYDIFKVMKENNCQPRILHPVKIFFKNKGKIKIVGTNKSWENFITNRTAQQEVLQAERKWYQMEIWIYTQE